MVTILCRQGPTESLNLQSQFLKSGQNNLQDMDEHGQMNGLLLEDIQFENVFQFLAEIFKHALVITIFVMIMMLLIEYITVQTKGRWSKPFEKNLFLQVIFAALMGLVPGCLGNFVVVALFAHQILNFAALVTALLASSGDEAFIMLAMMPAKALVLFLVLFLIAIATGLILNLFPFGRAKMYLPANHMRVHQEDPDCTCFVPSLILPQLKKISFERAVLLGGGLVFMIFILSGDLGPTEWNWSRVIFLFVALVEVFISATVPDHFLVNHLWGHVIRRHFLKVFLWTFGAFVVIHTGLEFLHLEEWLKNNLFLVLLIALIVGIIPESGPHLIFVTLFVSGSIPFSVLLANSIVQDGHGALPLLAESRKSFIYMKAVNFTVGLLAGITGILAGF
jgi:Putative, 10TM heavy-metal exporter